MTSSSHCGASCSKSEASVSVVNAGVARGGSATRTEADAGSGRTSDIRTWPQEATPVAPREGSLAPRDAAGELASREPRAGDEAHNRTEAPGRRGADEMEARERRLEAAREQRIPLVDPKRAHELLREEPQAGHV